MIGASAVALLLIAGFPGSARAVSLHDLEALSRAGLSDNVLIALIQSDRTIYGVDAQQILALKRAGVSDPVIVALLRNGRQPETSTAPSAAAPQPVPAPVSVAPAAPAVPQASPAAGSAVPGLVIIGGHSRPAAPAAVTEVVVVPTPGYYPVATFGRGRTGRAFARSRALRHVAGTGFAAPVAGQVGALPNGLAGNGCVTVGGARGIHIGGAFVDGVHFQNPIIIGARVRGQGGGRH